jgi:hypothetical protein
MAVLAVISLTGCVGVRRHVGDNPAVSIHIPLDKPVLEFALAPDGGVTLRSPRSAGYYRLHPDRAEEIGAMAERVMAEVPAGDYSNDASNHETCVIVVEKNSIKLTYNLKHDQSLSPAPKALLDLMWRMSSLSMW